MSKKTFDVFLSHSSGDRKWVRRLQCALEERGLRVWLDSEQIDPGDLIVNSLERALESCKSVAFVISPESTESGWVAEEYSRAVALCHSRRPPIRLIPVLLHDAKLPGFLANRVFVDFRDDVDFDETVEHLIRGIMGSCAN